MPYALILGGTKGLGRSLAVEALQRKITPVVIGRSINEAMRDPQLRGAEFYAADLTQPNSAANITAGPNWFNDLSYVFWVAGIFLRKRLTKTRGAEISAMVRTHLEGPWNALRYIHTVMLHQRLLANPPGKPYHLITIASTSSWRIREHEAIYCALKAAKAVFTRNFCHELVADLPGSKVTLVNPGGMKTPDFWKDTGQDISKFMETDEVARVIWNHILDQTGQFLEMQIIRNDDGSPRVEYGARAPETPSF